MSRTAGRTLAIQAGVLLVLALVASCGDDTTQPAPPEAPGDSYPVTSYREAARITGKGALAAMRDARAEWAEQSVKELIGGVFVAEGCTQAAFDPIVAAGANAIVLHYAGGDSLLRQGSLLLIDIGATSGGICSDCSRTFPVGPKFSPRQRELYQLVLDVQSQVAASASPGQDTFIDLDDRATSLLQSSALRAMDEGDTLRTMDRFFKHFLGHYVGKQVHGGDTGWLSRSPIRPGQVLTLEPGVYIPSEGIGIRIEDTYLVTENGLECLTCDCPKVVAEVEEMRAAGPASLISFTPALRLPSRSGRWSVPGRGEMSGR